MPITQIDPYYRVGTATFAASTAVVGQGTQWLSNVEPGDQIFNRLGQMAVVASVNSDTSITLVAPFAGTVQTAQVYTIFRVSDSVRMENFAQRMINLLTGGNVTSFGNLDGAGGGKVPVFTGAGALNNLTFAELLTAIGGAPASALATAALKAANLSDMANKRIALDNLQLKGANIASAATVDLTAATGHYVDVTGTATTTAITLAAGSWRMVRAAAAWKITTSANLILNNGTEATHTFAANDLILFVSDGTIVRGVILPIDGRPTMQLPAARMLGSVAAGGVQDLTAAQVLSMIGAYAKSNILGTVSQASGVPTGAIIERGSNANGEYVRFADGTQICWRTWTANVAVNTAYTAFYYGSTLWSYPAAFIAGSSPSVAGNARPSGRLGWLVATDDANAATVHNAIIFSSESFTANVVLRMMAVGRWF